MIGGDTNIVLSLSKAASQACDHAKGTSLARKLHKGRAIALKSFISYRIHLDGYSGYNQIEIALEDQEKTTFTCHFGTFAFRKMPFGLCNAPGTFQRCMMGIFSDMTEIILEIFMDDFSIFGDSYEGCLENLRKVLERCQEKNLVLNWEKCHFMVTQGIVLGHIVSKNGIEVDKAKVELISNLPTPKCVRDIRSFLGQTIKFMPCNSL